MADLIATVGALRFALKREECTVAMPDFVGRPFAIMLDGTEVQLLEREGKSFLLVDHRRDPALQTRIEYWECLDRGEGEILGLYALANTRLARVRREPVLS
jgi:hypothetical protein